MAAVASQRFLWGSAAAMVACVGFKQVNAEGACYISECGCPGAFKQSWCTDEVGIGKMPAGANSYCYQSSSNCEASCSGVWCEEATTTLVFSTAATPPPTAAAAAVTQDLHDGSGSTFHDAQEEIIDGCFYQNHKYIGDDLLNGQPLIVSNFRECQSECQNNTQCYFFAHFTAHRTCYLGGNGAVYDNHGAEGAVCGPKWCPPIPSGCTDLPGKDFPGWTADQTEAMFTAHRQPEKMECWPKNATKGWYDTCAEMTVLEDFKYGWPAECGSLYKVPLTSFETCESKCTKEVYCSVYIEVGNPDAYHGSDCYLGEGVNCYMSEAVQGAVAGKRIMHGKVRVLANTTGYQIMGLQRAFDQNYFVTQVPDAVDSCRNHCYSNVECEWWQYSKLSGCWAENPNLASGPTGEGTVEYPITRNSWRSGTDYSDSFIAGEYIQHVCPGRAHVPSFFTAARVPHDLQYVFKQHSSLIHNITSYAWVKGAPLLGGSTIGGLSTYAGTRRRTNLVGAAAPGADQSNSNAIGGFGWICIILLTLCCCGGLAVYFCVFAKKSPAKSSRRGVDPMDSDASDGGQAGYSQREQYAEPPGYADHRAQLLNDPLGNP